MSENSKIEWTHATFNPWIGCTKVSSGCKNCYAEADMDLRRHRAEWGDAGTRSITSPSYWHQPVKWDQQAKLAGERRRVFCASLADIFEDWQGQLLDSKWEAIWWPSYEINALAFDNYKVPLTDAYAPVTQDMVRQKLFRLIENTPHLDWLMLTKRPENIMAKIPEHWRSKLPENVWIGTSVENEEAADIRIPHLLQVPASVRFLSCEPLLGPVDLSEYLTLTETNGDSEHFSKYGWCYDSWSGGFMGPGQNDTYDPRSGIHWIIAGGESGPNARPMHPDWARSLRNQCKDADVPFLFKQWGEWRQYDHCNGDNARPLGMFEEGVFRAGNIAWDQKRESVHMAKVGKKAAGRLLDGREWNEFPTVNQQP